VHPHEVRVGLVHKQLGRFQPETLIVLFHCHDLSPTGTRHVHLVIFYPPVCSGGQVGAKRHDRSGRPGIT
jgi:hypothetical protein